MNIEHTVDNRSELEARGYRIEAGWNDRLAEELIAASRQPHIADEKNGVPNDARKRFTDRQTAEEWYTTKNPDIFALRDIEGELGGVIWFDRNERPEIGAEYTFAIRMYESTRGTGLSMPFMREAHNKFFDMHEATGVWLECNTDNHRALRLYREFGYQEAGMEYTRIRMVYHKGNSI